MSETGPGKPDTGTWWPTCVGAGRCDERRHTDCYVVASVSDPQVMTHAHTTHRSGDPEVLTPGLVAVIPVIGVELDFGRCAGAMQNATRNLPRRSRPARRPGSTELGPPRNQIVAGITHSRSTTAGPVSMVASGGGR